MCGNEQEFPKRICCTCYVCGGPIWEDDSYMHFDGIDICENCIDDHMKTATYRKQEADWYD